LKTFSTKTKKKSLSTENRARGKKVETRKWNRRDAHTSGRGWASGYVEYIEDIIANRYRYRYKYWNRNIARN